MPAHLTFEFMKSLSAREIALVEAPGFLAMSVKPAGPQVVVAVEVVVGVVGA